MTLSISDMIWMLAVSVLLTEASASSSAEIIYMCPKRFHVVNKYCYHFSGKNYRRMDAYAYCESIHSSFAELQTKKEGQLLAEYLRRKYRSGKFTEYWIDGIYNHRLSRWHWGATGEVINSTFIDLNKGQSFMFKCIALDEKGRWTARSCIEPKKVICRTEAIGRIEFVVSEEKKRMKLDKCSSGVPLKKYESEVCSRLLGTAENSDPGFFSKPRSTKSAKRYQRWVCPPNMVLLGSKCYSFSEVKKTLKKAHFECRKNRTSLAFINTKKQDHNLRRFLNHFIEKQERWIDGVYVNSSGQWKSMESAKDLTYIAFISGMKTPEANQWYAIFMDPKHHNQWNIASEFEEKYFICQVKAKATKLLPRKKLIPPVSTIKIITK